jgi:hypothetical protein
MKQLFTLSLLLIFCNSWSQNQAKKWFFGYGAGLDFMNSPPTPLTGSLNTLEGCASIADNAGNLLFYSDGITVYDQNHNVMGNGTGLFGNSSSTQSGVIVKQPGSSSIYYLFTVACCGQANGLRYSVIDMSLAAGIGSVTIKNVLLQTPSSEKITATRHCNGSDVWVLTHDYQNDVYRNFLVTAAGVNTVPVTSTVGAIHSTFWGHIKTSPNGTKVAIALHSPGIFEISDFNNSTGVVSAPMTLSMVTGPYGCEFSPDGSKFYGSNWSNQTIYQWDLCAGSNTAIAASVYTVATLTAGGQLGSVQLGPDGKIYATKTSGTFLSTINFPNASGTACGFSLNAVSTGTKQCSLGLPNFITSLVNLPAFTHTVLCGMVNFSAPSVVTQTFANCSAAGSSTSTLTWNFGDPNSGSSNTSTLTNPTHYYSAPGTYTAQLVIYKLCSTDTIKNIVVVANAGPSLNISGTFSVCAKDKRTYTASGATSYSWNVTTTSVITTPTISLSPTVTTIYTLTGISNSCTSTKIFTLTVSKCTDIDAINEEEELRIYPNPVNDRLFVEAVSTTQLIITDAWGSVILETMIGAGKTEIKIADLKEGVYTLKTTSANNIKQYKFLKLADN